MRAVPVSQILVPENRQRREFESNTLMELTESIEKIGLLQPIIVRNHNDTSGPNFKLVAGERRLRAIGDLWSLGGQLRHNDQLVEEGFVPIVTLGDLSPLDAFEAELEENIRRVDLSWQEKAEAIRQLHTLRAEQGALAGKVHTVADTALELHGRADGSYQDDTKKQIIVAKHLDDPDIAKASTFRDAFKILERKEEARNHALHAAIVGQTFGAHSHTALLGDCLKWMDELEPGSFDCICTDPPYGMGADTFGDGAGKLVAITHEYEDSVVNFRKLMTEAAHGISRCAKPMAHLYVCCDIDQFHFLKEIFNAQGWQVFRTPLINVKLGSGRVPLPEHGPRRTYETILYAFRGGRKVTAIYPDVISTTGDDNLGHGAQKPVELYNNLLRRSCRAGDRILDPFCGTGTIFPAAHQLRAAATGIELEPAYYGIAVARLEELK